MGIERKSVRELLTDCNGSDLAKSLSNYLLEVQSKSPKVLLSQYLHGWSQLGSTALGGIVLKIAIALESAGMKDYSAAFTGLSAACDEFKNLFPKSEDSWWLPVLLFVMRILGPVSIAADKISSGELGVDDDDWGAGSKQSFGDKCQRQLYDIQARMMRSVKAGAIVGAACFIKFSFAINKLNMVRHIMRGVEHQILPHWKEYPASHIAEFQFYRGKYYVFTNEEDKASRALSHAFNICKYQSSEHNISLILNFLIPLTILVDRKLPRSDVLQVISLEVSTNQ